jgi:hypothetical protein
LRDPRNQECNGPLIDEAAAHDAIVMRRDAAGKVLVNDCKTQLAHE